MSTPTPSALRGLLQDAHRHEDVPVTLSRRLRATLWCLLLLDLACAVAHRLLLQPWASGGLADVLSWGGHWALATAAMLAAAAALAVLAVLTDGYRQATAAHLTATRTSAAACALAAGPTLVVCVLAAVLFTIAIAVMSMILFGLLASLLE